MLASWVRAYGIFRAAYSSKLPRDWSLRGFVGPLLTAFISLIGPRAAFASTATDHSGAATRASPAHPAAINMSFFMPFVPFVCVSNPLKGRRLTCCRS